MALFDDGFKLGTAVLIGIGALIVVPVIIPVVGPALKPLAKATIKSGIALVQKGRELISEAGETLEDIAAEVRAELIAERAGRTENPQPGEAA